MTRIAILITCYNRRDMTVSCLSALQRQSNVSGFRLTTYAVDDGCTDGTAAAIASFPNVCILRGDGNLFWVRGMHLAFATAMRDGHDGYLWLNDDMLLDPDALDRLLETCEKIESRSQGPIIVVGSTRDPDSGKVTYGGVVRSKSRFRPLTFMRIEPGRSEVEVDTIEGNFVYIPNEAALLVGNLDPGFLHKGGDTDYGLRARAAGVRIWLMPGTIGCCRSNTAKATWRTPGVGIRERWNHLTGPNGLPWSQWGRFAKRHGGRFWMLYAFWAYRHFLWPRLQPEVLTISSKETPESDSTLHSTR